MTYECLLYEVQDGVATITLNRPDVFNAFNDQQSYDLQDALKQALKGRTSIVIAHRLSTVMEADQILVINNGVVAERGRHEELISAGGLYSELFTRQDLTAN